MSDLAFGDICTVTVTASAVSDQDVADPPDAMASDYVFSFAAIAADPCTLTYTPTYAIQGSGAAAALTGLVTTQGVVVGDFEGDDALQNQNPTYVNLVPAIAGPTAYSYSFGGQWGALDHALASPSLVGQVTGAFELHINADEPTVLDYNTNFKSAAQVAGFCAPDQFRAADHDPVVVDLHLYTVITGRDGRRDHIVGTEGSDRILSGTGPDVVAGLGGRDLFTYLTIDDGPDTLIDYVPGEDVIDLYGVLRSVGFGGGDALATGWVRVVGVKSVGGRGAHSLVQIDTNGPTEPDGYRTLAIVEGVTVEQLARSGNFIF